jgi:hypothetical protein
METALGFFGIVVWIVSVISLAAAITWVVVKLSPGEKPNEPNVTPKSEA